MPYRHRLSSRLCARADPLECIRKLLRVPVKALPAGTYAVKWHVLSVDTHTTEGNFTFHVAP